MSANTHPERIIDKNGRATTVHKRNDVAKVGGVRQAIPPRAPGPFAMRDIPSFSDDQYGDVKDLYNLTIEDIKNIQDMTDRLYGKPSYDLYVNKANKVEELFDIWNRIISSQNSMKASHDLMCEVLDEEKELNQEDPTPGVSEAIELWETKMRMLED